MSEGRAAGDEYSGLSGVPRRCSSAPEGGKAAGPRAKVMTGAPTSGSG